MNIDFGQITFFLGVLGVFTGGVALVVAIEVARRSQDYLRKHAAEMNQSLATRIQKQDRMLEDALTRYRRQLDDFERLEVERDRRIQELHKGLDARFATQEGILLDRQRQQDDSLASVERDIVLHHKQLVKMGTVLQSIAEEIERRSSLPSRDELTMPGIARPVARKPDA